MEAKLVHYSLDAAKTYNRSITAKPSELLTGCDSILLEITSLAMDMLRLRYPAKTLARPYANPFQVGGLSLVYERDWSKRRCFRERMRYVKLALRATMDPSELVKEVDRVRAQSYLLDAAVNAFTRLNSIRSYIAVPDSVPSNADRQRTQYSELDDISMVTQVSNLTGIV
ncbi:hypothetical protein GN958_ATG16805 [Phytophthora infestans]|nr:hypothetical protein GN958_ATG17607 [Phytophthora infestans]KAF4133998.1 hypothetical protein GN958_ATG16805 [Phytophthora infestans]